MAYQVAQLRKVSGTNTYMTPIESLIEQVSVPSPNVFAQTTNYTVQNNTAFLDYGLHLKATQRQQQNQTVTVQNYFQVGHVYYLRFKILKIPQYFYSGSTTYDCVETYLGTADTLSINLYLKNLNKTDDQQLPESIGTLTVPTLINEDDEKYSFYSFIFSPTKNFDTIVFRIARVSFDAIQRDSPVGYRNWLIDQLDEQFEEEQTYQYERYYNSTSDEKITIELKGKRIITGDSQDSDLCELNNILQTSKATKTWLKFGYQSRPGNIIVVNNQPIIVGRSGIYQIDNGTKITSFMLVAPNGSNNDNIDAFLLDYAYNDTQQS